MERVWWVWVYRLFHHTVHELLDCLPHSLIKRPGISSSLEGEAKFMVPRSPVMKGRHHLVVLEVLANAAAEHNTLVTNFLAIDQVLFRRAVQGRLLLDNRWNSWRLLLLLLLL